MGIIAARALPIHQFLHPVKSHCLENSFWGCSRGRWCPGDPVQHHPTTFSRRKSWWLQFSKTRCHFRRICRLVSQSTISQTITLISIPANWSKASLTWASWHSSHCPRCLLTPLWDTWYPYQFWDYWKDGCFQTTCRPSSTPLTHTWSTGRRHRRRPLNLSFIFWSRWSSCCWGGRRRWGRRTTYYQYQFHNYQICPRSTSCR